MSRSLALALVLALGGIAAPVAHAQELAALDPEVAAMAPASDGYAEDEGVPADETYAEDEGDYEDEEYLDEEVEFCGGDEELSVVDQAWDEMEYGDPETAYESLVSALRHGEVGSWERGRALAILAELQLRRGEPGRAIVNFRRAEAVEPGSIDQSRVQLATALYLRGESFEAREEAQAAHDELCSDTYAVAGCYAANLILSRTERDAQARVVASDAAQTLRQANPDLSDAFDAADARVAGS